MRNTNSGALTADIFGPVPSAVHALVADWFADTNIDLPLAYDFNVESLDTNQPPDDTLINIKEYLHYVHHWPHIWYQNSINSPQKYGFPLSHEVLGDNAPLSPYYGRYGRCDLTSETTDCLPGDKITKYIASIYGAPAIDFQNASQNGGTRQSLTGNVAYDGTSATEGTGSPVWFEVTTTTTETSNSLKFDYEFLSSAGAEGILTVFVDNQPVYTIEERITAPGINNAKDIWAGELSAGNHAIEFRLDAFTDVQSVARISNVQLGLLRPVEVVPEQAPKIERVETFREGVLVFFRLFFTDPNNDATGFGFRGANGAGWAEANFPFSSPSYGHVSPGRIEYPFNHLCGTGSEYESDVEAWIYDSTGLRSPSITVHLACSAPST
jgi:hypothetical protein